MSEPPPPPLPSRGLQWLNASTRKFKSSRIYHPRKRAVKPGFKLPSVVRTARQVENKKRKLDILTHQQEINRLIWAKAELLRETHGRRSVERYYEDLIKFCHVDKSKRKISSWNAFLHQESKKFPNGKPLHSHPQLSSLSLVQTPFLMELQGQQLLTTHVCSKRNGRA